MRQGSLFDTPDGGAVGLVGLLPAMRAAMNRAAAADPEGRKALVDKINEVARRERVALTENGGKGVSKETLDKWLQYKALEHAPGLEAIVCFCLATGSVEPLAPLLRMLDVCVIPRDSLKFLEYGQSCWEEKEARQRKRKLEAKL